MSTDFDHHDKDLEQGRFSDQKLMLRGAAGQVEAVTAYPEGFQSGDPISVICHPHPLYGGSMSNKVVHMIAAAFKELGVASLRFNFRGVGKSEGRYDEGRGEAEDLRALASWFRARHPGSPLWLAGFSFGAYVSARACEAIGPERLLLVAPPVSLYDFHAIPPIEIPYMVVQGSRDEVIDPGAVNQWVEAQRHRPVYHWMADADHFFHGRIIELRDTIVRSWG